MKLVARIALMLLLPFGLVAPAFGQVQTGELTGTVKTSDELVLPGATVSISSPALQGSRVAVSDGNGAYVFRALPPGEYTVTVEMSGMAPRTERVVVELGRTARLDVTLGLAAITETVTVTAATESAALTSTQVGANYKAEEIDTLPTGRTPALIAELAPGLTANTPNVGQVAISGSFAYDNVFLINGVDINDNLFGTANNVFIEDAIAETTVMTSGISAEYGRFSGGVVNMITKSGGNDFSGSFRSTFTNDAWTRETPFEEERDIERQDKLNKNYEGTFGGPVLRDRLWFFTAGRYQKTTGTQTLQQTGLPFNNSQENKRYELKGTGTFANGHTVSANFIDNSTESVRVPFAFTIDPRVPESPTFPNKLFVANWNGVINPRVLGTFQFSQKKFGFRGTGGKSTDILDSPFLTRGFTAGVPGTLHYNGNYFDSTDPEDRDNRQFAGSLSYFLSTANTGSHDFKAGFDHFTSTRVGGNSQTATGYVYNTDYVLGADGKPLLDSQGRIVPAFVPGLSRRTNWLPTRGAQVDIRTLSLFVQDRWLLNPRLTLNLGARYEQVRSEATGGIVGVDTDTMVPRLALSYDPKGDGKTVVQGSYAHYSGKYSESQFADNTPVGNPTSITYVYNGPAGQGVDFAPAFDISNYSIIGGNFPTANIFFEEGLSSPTTREITVSVGRDLWGRGSAKLTFTNRDYYNFVEDFIDDPSEAGKVTVIQNGRNFGTFDKVIFRNSDDPERAYRGLQLQAGYRLFDNLHLEGHWTMQLENDGNFEGEGTNTPGVSSGTGDYPEILVEERNFPTGRLNQFQRHKLRLWAVYTQDMGRFGTFDIAPLWRVESGLSYSLTATSVPLSAVQLARNPGYARLPGSGSQTLYFGERGSQSFEGYGLMDLSINYNIPVYRDLRPWIKAEVLNVFDNQKQIAWSTTVRPDPNSPLDEHGLPTGYIKPATFGTATATTHFPRWRAGQNGGRTFILYAGVRF